MVLTSRKAITEIVSFSLLLFLMLVLSIIAYNFSKSEIESNLNQLDLSSIEQFYKNFDSNFNYLILFNNSQISTNIKLNSGEIYFNGTKIQYQSLVKTLLNKSYCINFVCYYNVGGFEKLEYTLRNNYSFNSNFSLGKGEYLLSFKNIKNEKKIQVQIIE